tara:strand:+ start:784 stop:1008 length:225 start_codon:yes stop_codon:yes gene_type:complete
MDYSFQNSERNAWAPGPQQENKWLRDALARGVKTFDDANIVHLYTDETVAISEGWHDIYIDATTWINAILDGEA